MNKFDELIKIVKKLRAPDGCEWDREQTHESLIPYLLEETHEVIESIENKQDDIHQHVKDCHSIGLSVD